MPRVSAAIDALPRAAGLALARLGDELATARKRRKQSMAGWAQRLQVSVPTLRRMERGDPAVSAGVYATALWLINRHEVLAHAADPKEDVAALEVEVRRAQARHGPRKS